MTTNASDEEKTPEPEADTPPEGTAGAEEEEKTGEPADEPVEEKTPA